jgi:hypothetical protein
MISLNQQDELTDLNILVLQEPNIYFGLHDWAIKNQHLFSLILTWDDKVLNNCDNASFFSFWTYLVYTSYLE